MLMSGRTIPAIGEPPTPHSIDNALKLFCHLWVCLLAYRLGIKVYSNLTCPVDPIDFNRFTLCPCAMTFFQGCALPPSSYFMLLSSAPPGPTMLPLQSSRGITKK